MPATLPRVVVVALLTAVLTLPLAAAAQPTKPPRPVSGVAQEPHPQIMAAIRALEAARLHLQRAAHDFGGHRVTAICEPGPSEETRGDVGYVSASRIARRGRRHAARHSGRHRWSSPRRRY